MAIEEHHDSSSEIVSASPNHAVSTRKKPNLTDEQRIAVYKFLLTKQKDPERFSKLVKGALSVAAMKFGVTADIVSAIWKRAQQSLADGNISADLGSFKCGRVEKGKILMSTRSRSFHLWIIRIFGLLLPN
ncbi:uncharacterized protein PHALS_08113 [Plasmopara halstedii]|uniref:DUF7769 domain-containing protein n=1 Tax=Plasmopara halstedii TaxID=4781 RepID=A0A0P1B6E8_PLAHL|nr:uncharacterized protein PHALS_08113 [Plasmopara halstedii]CEG50401.1 hypothetical protein PHALS_08113 [Plasmopara halstedii]|eukprot:XP_024586770.1 hypothetical protein PHALS_08113 [Plasmopara halstedii]